MPSPPTPSLTFFLCRRRKTVKALLSQRALPEEGWDDATIELFLQARRCAGASRERGCRLAGAHRLRKREHRARRFCIHIEPLP